MVDYGRAAGKPGKPRGRGRNESVKRATMAVVSTIAVFVIGPDRPGIIAAAAQVLFEQGCNLQDVSQTSLQGQFVGIFLAAAAGPPRLEELQGALRERLAPLGSFVHLRSLDEPAGRPVAAAEPFVITTVGPDRPGLVAGISGLLAECGANITNLKAVPRGAGAGQEYVTFYEVDIPAGIDRQAFRKALRDRGRELGLDVNLQHREIFEQVHRI
jgi:glycine cleavage system transcriptional repressor